MLITNDVLASKSVQKTGIKTESYYPKAVKVTNITMLALGKF